MRIAALRDRARAQPARRRRPAASRSARSRAASSRATSESSPNARAIALSATPSSASPSSATAASKRSHSSARTAARPRAGAQLVGELHVPGAGMGTMREAEQIGVAQRGGLLLGGVGDRAHALREAKVRRRLDARLERVAPALVGELHLFERDAGIAAHDCVRGPGPTVMMWSAICRGAAVRRSARVRGLASGGGLLADVRRRGVGQERAVDLRATHPPGPARADGREAAALDPRADGRGMELQLLADLRHRQPRILVWSGPVGIGQASIAATSRSEDISVGRM